MADSHLVMGWSSHWTMLKTAQPTHPTEASRMTGSSRGKRSLRI
jgi:hypothetical protein